MKEKLSLIKEKLPRVLLYISFVPYALLFLYALFCSVEGFTFLFSTSYGLEAFLDALLIMGLFFCIIPVLPVCLIYQIFYLCRNRLKKMGFPRNISFKRFAVVLGIIVAVWGLLVFIDANSYTFKEMGYKIKVRAMVRRADTAVTYDYAKIACGGLLGLEDYKSSTIFIDYDTHMVGFLVYGDLEEYYDVKLKKQAEGEDIGGKFNEKYAIQAEIPLEGPGFYLWTWSEDASLKHRTCALLLQMEDGTRYYSENFREPDTGFSVYTGLNYSHYYSGER